MGSAMIKLGIKSFNLIDSLIFVELWSRGDLPLVSTPPRVTVRHIYAATAAAAPDYRGSTSTTSKGNARGEQAMYIERTTTLQKLSSSFLSLVSSIVQSTKRITLALCTCRHTSYRSPLYFSVYFFTVFVTTFVTVFVTVFVMVFVTTVSTATTAAYVPWRSA
jgi:hypothetical protein